MDLSKVPIRVMDINEVVVIPKYYYEKTDIINIPEFKINLKINIDANQEYNLTINGKGNMVLLDAITLEEVFYPFNILISEKIDEEYDRFITKHQNTLDIIGILWENIVLEVPISYSIHEHKNEKHDGWELINEKEKEVDPRLAPLLELFDEEKE